MLRNYSDAKLAILKYDDSDDLRNYLKARSLIVNMQTDLLEQRYTDIYDRCYQALIQSYDSLTDVIDLVKSDPLLRNNIALATMKFLASNGSKESCIAFVATLLENASTPIPATKNTANSLKYKQHISCNLLLLQQLFSKMYIAEVFIAVLEIAVIMGNTFNSITLSDGELCIDPSLNSKDTTIQLSTDDEIIACAVKLGYPYNQYVTATGASNYLKSIVPQITYIDSKVIKRLGILAGQYDSKQYPDVLSYMVEGYDALIQEERRTANKDEMFSVMLEYLSRTVDSTGFDKSLSLEENILKFCRKAIDSGRDLNV